MLQRLCSKCDMLSIVMLRSEEKPGMYLIWNVIATKSQQR